RYARYRLPVRLVETSRLRNRRAALHVGAVSFRLPFAAALRSGAVRRFGSGAPADVRDRGQGVWVPPLDSPGRRNSFAGFGICQAGDSIVSGSLFDRFEDG